MPFDTQRQLIIRCVCHGRPEQRWAVPVPRSSCVRRDAAAGRKRRARRTLGGIRTWEPPSDNDVTVSRSCVRAHPRNRNVAPYAPGVLEALLSWIYPEVFMFSVEESRPLGRHNPLVCLLEGGMSLQSDNQAATRRKNKRVGAGEVHNAQHDADVIHLISVEVDERVARAARPVMVSMLARRERSQRRGNGRCRSPANVGSASLPLNGFKRHMFRGPGCANA